MRDVVLRFLGSVFLLFFSFVSKAQNLTWTTAHQEAYNTIFAFKNSENALQKLDLNSPYGIYLDNYALMIKGLVSDKESVFNDFEAKQETRREIVEALPDNLPEKRFLVGESRLQQAFLQLKFGHEIAATWNIVKAYKLFSENTKFFPNHRPTLKSLGLLHILVASVPENYAFILKSVGLTGASIKKGLNELDEAQNDPVFGQEAALVKMALQAFVLNDSGAEEDKNLRKLLQKNPDNLLIRFFVTIISMKKQQGEQALNYLKNRPHSADYIPFAYLYNLEAELYLQKGEYALSEGNYALFLKQNKGKNFLKDTYYRMAMGAYLAGNTGKTNQYLQMISKVVTTVIEGDQEAQRFHNEWLKNKKMPNKNVLKARFAFDGGYFQQALETIKGISEEDFDTPFMKAEYSYRFGRILQKMNRNEESKKQFLRTIDLAESTKNQFGALSSLQLGYLYKDEKEWVLSKKYFQKALTYPKNPHKNSVDNQAKAALAGLGR